MAEKEKNKLVKILLEKNKEKKIDKKNLEELSKVIKEVSKKKIEEPKKKVEEPSKSIQKPAVEEKKAPQKKEEDEEIEIEDEDLDFFDSETGFVRQVKHNTLDSGLRMTNVVDTNLEDALQDVAIESGKTDKDFYTAAKYGASYDSGNAKYSTDQLVSPQEIQRNIPGVNNSPNEFVRDLNNVPSMGPSDPQQQAYTPRLLDEDKARFGTNTENEHIRKYKNL